MGRPISFVASCDVSYKYACERCGKTTETRQTRITQTALFTQSGSAFRLSAESSAAAYDKARGEALRRINGAINAIKSAVEESAREVVTLNEPFIAEIYNETFSEGKECPYCGSRQTWYPASPQPAAAGRAAVLSALVSAVLGCAALALVQALVFPASPLPVSALFTAELLITAYGALIAYGYSRAAIKAGRRYYVSAVKRLKPDVVWGAPEVTEIGGGEFGEGEPLEDPPRKEDAGFTRRGINIESARKEDLMCWKLRGLKHDNIIFVKDITGDGFGYLTAIEERFGGTPLSELLGGEISKSAFQDYMLQLCDALEFLHSRTPPVSHNAVTPDNILIGKDDELKLKNFDIATFGDSCGTDIAAVGKIIASFKPAHIRRYRKVIAKCESGYASFSELKEDLHRLMRRNAAKYVAFLLAGFTAYRVLRVLARVIGSFLR